MTEFFTRKQIAEALGLHPMTILRWGREGKLPEYKLGTAVRYAKQDVEKLLADAKVTHVAP